MSVCRHFTVLLASLWCLLCTCVSRGEYLAYDVGDFVPTYWVIDGSNAQHGLPETGTYDFDGVGPFLSNRWMRAGKTYLDEGATILDTNSVTVFQKMPYALGSVFDQRPFQTGLKAGYRRLHGAVRPTIGMVDEFDGVHGFCRGYRVHPDEPDFAPGQLIRVHFLMLGGGNTNGLGTGSARFELEGNDYGSFDTVASPGETKGYLEQGWSLASVPDRSTLLSFDTVVGADGDLDFSIHDVAHDVDDVAMLAGIVIDTDPKAQCRAITSISYSRDPSGVPATTRYSSGDTVYFRLEDKDLSASPRSYGFAFIRQGAFGRFQQRLAYLARQPDGSFLGSCVLTRFMPGNAEVWIYGIDPARKARLFRQSRITILPEGVE